jgi:hypothetical protein
MKRRLGTYGVLAAVAVGLLATALPASASVQGRRNTAAALSGAALYELMRGNTNSGLLLGAGAAYAWKRADDENRWWHRDRYYGYYGPGPYTYYVPYLYPVYGYGYYDRDDRRWDRDRDRRFSHRDWGDRGRRDRDDRGWRGHRR